MKTIQLTKGKVALVDDEDYNWLNQWKWHAHKSNTGYYAIRSITINKSVSMHNIILNPGTGLITDHKDRDSLNNQRYNLRIATRSQNSANRKKSKNCSSLYLGVTWNKKDNVFRARLRINGKRINLGNFKIETDAAKAYNTGAKKYHGEFASLNNV